jgi:hypothetical protein
LLSPSLPLVSDLLVVPFPGCPTDDELSDEEDEDDEANMNERRERDDLLKRLKKQQFVQDS